MSTTEQAAQPEQAAQAEQPEQAETTISLSKVSALDLLTDAQRKAIGTRFNKSWLKPRQTSVQTLIAEHGFSFFEACFAQALLEEADTIISNKQIAVAGDRMASLAGELFGSEPNKEEALRAIEATYETLDDMQRVAAGKRFRKLVQQEMTSKLSVRILEMVCAKLDVREQEWC